MSKTNLTHARTCVYNVNYHMVWSVKYRRKVLDNGIDEETKRLFFETAKEKDFIIHSMEVMPDHVHVFVSPHPKIS